MVRSVAWTIRIHKTTECFEWEKDASYPRILVDDAPESMVALAEDSLRGIRPDKVVPVRSTAEIPADWGQARRDWEVPAWRCISLLGGAAGSEDCPTVDDVSRAGRATMGGLLWKRRTLTGARMEGNWRYACSPQV